MEEGVIVKIVHCRAVDLDECINYYASRGYTYKSHETVLMRKAEVDYYQKNVWVPEKYNRVFINKKVPVFTVSFERKRTNNIDKAMELEKQICKLDDEIKALKHKPGLGVMWMVIVWPIMFLATLIVIFQNSVPGATKLVQFLVVGVPSLVLTILGIVYLCKSCKERKEWESTSKIDISKLEENKSGLEAEMKKLYQSK